MKTLKRFLIAKLLGLLLVVQKDQINVSQQEAQAAAEGWAHRSVVALDIFLNVFLFRGREDETISTHAYRASLEGKKWGIALNWALNLIQGNHGARASSDTGREYCLAKGRRGHRW